MRIRALTGTMDAARAESVFGIADGDARLVFCVFAGQVQFVALVAAGSIDQRRTEARKAPCARTADTGIHDAVGALREQEAGQSLGRLVALRNGFGLQALRVVRGGFEYVEVGVEISLPVIIGGGVGWRRLAGRLGIDDVVETPGAVP